MQHGWQFLQSARFARPLAPSIRARIWTLIVRIPMAKPFKQPKSPIRRSRLSYCDNSVELIGYAQLRWGTAPPCVSALRPAEIQRIYADQRWHGKGVAQALISQVLTAAARGNADQVWLGVWENNYRAMSFYQKFGFNKVGHHVFQLGADPQHDWILSRDVQSWRSGA